MSHTVTDTNILMIVGDDFGYSDIGVFGAEISTPNLDFLTKEGKILSNYHIIHAVDHTLCLIIQFRDSLYSQDQMII